MKRLIITIAILVAAMSGLKISAQGMHEFSVYGGGGLSTLNYKLSVGNASKGFGGDLGFGYTYLFSTVRVVETGTVSHKQWGIHTGIGFGFYNANTKLNDGVKTITSYLRDNEGDRFILHTKLSAYNETQNTVFLNIPAMAQFQAGQFYALGGIKMGIPLSSKYNSKEVALSNEAYYPEFKNWAETQTFAGYGSFKDKNYDGTIDLGIAMMLALEAGMNFDLSNNFSLYGGVYFDYGLNNIATSERLEFINYSSKSPEEFNANSVLSSYTDNSKSYTFTDKVNIMAVGIKVRLALKK